MAEEKMGFFKRLVAGLNKTRDNIVSGMDSIFHGFSKIDEDFYEELEEVLIMGDLGVKATYAILDDLRKKVKEQHIKEPIECRQLLIDSIKEQMDVGETAYEFENQTSVVLVIGVNGVGKTTTIGKLAGKMRGQGKKVVLAAADTFRAAAGDQLKEWAHRSDADPHDNMQIPVEGRRGGRQHCNDPAVHGKRIMLHIFLQYHIHGMYQFRSRTVLPVGILHRDGQHRILKGIITILQKAVANRLFL